MSVMPEIIDRFAQVAEGLARLNRYPFAERHALWIERLKVNLPELRILDMLEDVDGGTRRADSGAGWPVGQQIPEHFPGIAAIARQARLGLTNIIEPSLLALARAGEHSDLNAFIELASKADLARQADKAAAASRAGAVLPLLGVPVAIKDLMAVEGFELTGGTQRWNDKPSGVDATAVSRLRDAGALILGTTNLHELAYGITSENPHYGFVGNPRGRGFIPGGSSGGSAAAVAADIVRASVGTDTAGSIRIPAACCGVVGFKPTYDAVPRHGALDLGPSLDHLGPITRSVGDAALMFSVMAGGTAAVPTQLPSLAGIRVGVPTNYFFEPLAADVAKAVQSALDRMRADGAQLVPVDLPGIELSAAVQFATLCSEATNVHWQRLLRRPQSLGQDVRVRLEIGQLFPAFWYTRAQRVRARLAAMFDSVMDNVDVLATPTLRVTAPASGSSSVEINGRAMALHSAVTSLTLPFNLTGMPALTLPCGTGANGLPIGLQLAAARRRDWDLLAVSHRIENLLE